MTLKLGDICSYRKEKINVTALPHSAYVSTESMLPNRNGIGRASNIPELGKASAYFAGDVLISNIRPYFKKIWLANMDGGCSNDVLVFKPEKCSSEYLYWLLSSDVFFEYVMSTSKGTKMPRGDKSAIMDYPIPNNDEMAQHDIVSILNPLQLKIELNRQINDYLDEYATALFEKWLYRCKETTAIGDIAEEILDYTKLNAPLVRPINSSDVTEGVFPNPDPVENKDLKGHFKKRFKKYDVLYSEIRPRNHHYGYVMFDADDWISTTRLMVIRNKPEKVSSGLLYYYLKSRPVTEEFSLKTETRSGTFPQGKYADIAAIKVPYSPIEMQSEVAEQIAAVLETIFVNQIESEGLSQLRDALLPKLMSGEIDVSKVDLTQPNNHL